MSISMSKLERFTELMSIMEQAFIHKLKLKNPQITPQEIQVSLRAWYQDRPQAPNGDAPGKIGDISKFLDE